MKISHILNRLKKLLLSGISLPVKLKHLLKDMRSDIHNIRQAENLIASQIEALQNDVYNVKQVANLIAMRQRPGRNIKVVFLVHNIGAWDSIADVLAAMQQADDFIPIVASINRKFPGDETFGMEPLTHARLDEMGIPHIRLGMENSFEALDILKTIAPDIIFRQSQWDQDFPPALRTAELRFTRLCYVSYEILSMVETPHSGMVPGTDTIFHRSCWLIFCAVESVVTRFSTTAVRQSSNVICTGHPKVERLIRKGERPYWPIVHPDKNETHQKKGTTKILWSAHHSIGNDWIRFGLFPTIYRDMLAWAESSPDVEIVFSPHPGCLKATVSRGYLSQQELDDFLGKWNALPNTAVLREGDYAQVMAASDCLICDGLSFLMEYQLFNKPVIFLERKDHVAFTDDGQRIIEGTHRVSTLDEAKALAARFKDGYPDPLYKKQIDNAQWLKAYGNAAQNILAAIRNGMKECNQYSIRT